jgi:hypothetical protein
MLITSAVAVSASAAGRRRAAHHHPHAVVLRDAVAVYGIAGHAPEELRPTVARQRGVVHHGRPARLCPVHRSGSGPAHARGSASTDDPMPTRLTLAHVCHPRRHSHGCFPARRQPAQRAGLLAGDQIIAIDNSSTLLARRSEVERLLGGPGFRSEFARRRSRLRGGSRLAPASGRCPDKAPNRLLRMLDKGVAYYRLAEFSKERRRTCARR